MTQSKIPVGILGATGSVGQVFILLLRDHPWFEVAEVAASPRSAGKSFADACHWHQQQPMPRAVANMEVREAGVPLESHILFSGMVADVAGEIETKYANQGHVVISNSKNHRMDEDVPLVIPEINHDHLRLLSKQLSHQSSNRPHRGGIVTNSNCVTMFLAMVLAPLHRRFGVKLVQLTTMQAISGAGYPGVPALDIVGNVIPYIGGEEEKVEQETRKILGTLKDKDTRVEPAPCVISAQCNRVPVANGHLMTLSIKFDDAPTDNSPTDDASMIEQVTETLGGFSGLPQQAGLPSAPKNPIIVLEERNRPQPAYDLSPDRTMSAIVGRIRPCPVLDVKMVVLGHNTVRGAAGAAILNAEMLHHLNILKPTP